MPNDGLYETLDHEQDSERQSRWSSRPRSARIHIGTWAYVYTIGYRPDMVPAGIKFESWDGPLEAGAEGQDLGCPISTPAIWSPSRPSSTGGDAATWEKGSAKLKALKPNFKALLRQRRRPRSS